MTLEESKEVLPILEEMILQLEEQQELMAEMYQELENSNQQLVKVQELNQELEQLNKELLIQLEALPSTEEMLCLLEIQDKRIQELEIENQQWSVLAQKLNSENIILQQQNVELLKLSNE